MNRRNTSLWIGTALVAISLGVLGTCVACSGQVTGTDPDETTDSGPRVDSGSGSESDSGQDPPPPPPPSTDPRTAANVFFLGHSLVNFEMPGMTAGIASLRERDHEWAAHVGIGASLSWIYQHPENGQGEDPFTSLPSGRWDVLVMTEALDIRTHTQFSDTVGYAGRFYDLAMQGNPNTQTYFYETWHFRDEDYDWRERLDSDREIWEGVIDQVNAQKDGPDMLMVPAGTAMARLHDRVAAGQVPGLSSMEELFVDHIHLNPIGNYFVACVMYATIYRDSPVGVSAQLPNPGGEPYQAPAPETARAFQEIAWEVVSADPRAGVAR